MKNLEIGLYVSKWYKTLGNHRSGGVGLKERWEMLKNTLEGATLDEGLYL